MKEECLICKAPLEYLEKDILIESCAVSRRKIINALVSAVHSLKRIIESNSSCQRRTDVERLDLSAERV